MKNIGLIFILVILIISCRSEEKVHRSTAPEGMVLIPAGEFLMGGKSEQASPDEYPRRTVKVDAFYMDETEVTNREFAQFVEATDYVTVAERLIDWEEMAKTLPPGTPRSARWSFSQRMGQLA